MPQSRIAREVISHGGDIDRDVGRINGHGAHVSNFGALQWTSLRSSFPVKLVVPLVHQRADRSDFQVSFRDLALNDLALVELGRSKRAAGRGRDLDQLVDRSPRGADRDAAVFL